MARARPRIISLFTGAGGLDYGFEAAGYRTAVALEMDPICVETLRANRSWPVINRDIHDVTGREVLKAGNLRCEEVDLVIGGPPCQPFSKSGYWSNGDAKRMGDSRASTLAAMLRIVRDVRPRAILIENVDALAYRGKDEGLNWLLDEFRRINAETGTRYCPSVAVLNAADYGVPQRRRRIMIVASRDGRPFEFPEPSHSGKFAKPELPRREPHTTAWDAIGDLPSMPNENLSPRGRWSGLLPSIPEGRNYLYHTDHGDGVPLFGWRRRYWSFLLKLAKARPSWTIQAAPGPATGPFHWENRLLSARELCRLQTIPDDVEIVGDWRAVQRQVGNAVPSLLAEVIARAIREQLVDGVLATASPSLLPLRGGAPPDPEPVSQVPERYLDSVGMLEPHPGKGLGPGAAVRKAA